MPLRPVISALSFGFLCLTFGVVGCGDGSGSDGLRVEVDFDPGTPRSARDEAVRVEVHLVSSCQEVFAGERPASSVASTYVLRDGGGPPLGNDFDAGDYGLHALAQDANCAVVAAGCEPVTIEPDDRGVVAVTLSSFAGDGCFSNQRCVLETGNCANTGSGGTGGAGGAGAGGAGDTDDCVGAADQTPCVLDGADGVCRMGACCPGCWNGTTCKSGKWSQACGTGGELCQFVPGCPS